MRKLSELRPPSTLKVQMSEDITRVAEDICKEQTESWGEYEAKQITVTVMRLETSSASAASGPTPAYQVSLSYVGAFHE